MLRSLLCRLVSCVATQCEDMMRGRLQLHLFEHQVALGDAEDAQRFQTSLRGLRGGGAGGGGRGGGRCSGTRTVPSHCILCAAAAAAAVAAAGSCVHPPKLLDSPT